MSQPSKIPTKLRSAPLLCWDLTSRFNRQTPPDCTLPIGGYTAQSLTDYEGRVASIVFTQGCNFNCHYCHNRPLIEPGKGRREIVAEVLQRIENMRSFIDAVVITGGEPTLHPSLMVFIQKIKEMGLEVKLDTNGTRPDRLEGIINSGCADYIAMDIKAPLNIEKYSRITGVSITPALLKKIACSIDILKEGKIDFEFRTTLDKELTPGDLREMATLLTGKYFLQRVENTESRVNLNEKAIVEAMKDFHQPGLMIRIR